MRGRAFFAAGGACAVLALLVWLIPVGYGMSALCLAALAACLVFCGFVRRRGTKKARRIGIAGAAVLAAGLGLFLAAEIPVIADARSDADTAADYIIVMGAGINGTRPSLSLSDRLERALVWLEENPDAAAVVSGSRAEDEAVSEAQVMYDWLIGRGVSPSRVLMEEQADNSYENILYSLAVIEADGGDPSGRVALLSNGYHLHRLRYIARRLGCQPVCVAARASRPSLAVNYAVREGFAMWRYWLFGMA